MCAPWTDEVSAISRVIRAMRDPFFPETELKSLQHTMLSAWHSHIASGVDAAMNYAHSHGGNPTQSEVNGIIAKIHEKVNGASFVKSDFRHSALHDVVGAFHKAKREEKANFVKQTKSDTIKDDFNVQIVDGMTEFEALNAISDQIFIAAGDFWDSQLQQSIKTELESYLGGGLTREEFGAKLKELVNTRLVSSNQDTLGDSYFKRLAHNTIVKTRTLGKFSQAKQLGALRYKLINPMDSRTSTICRELVARGTLYTMDEAQPVVDDILTSKTTADIKAKQPFWKSPNEARVPIPPLHWGDCRTTIRPMYI